MARPRKSNTHGRQTATKAGFLTKHAEQQSRPAIAVVLVYHDLRVANEGIDIEQIAAVFD